MPKMKTKRAAAKRFHVTGSGKLKRMKAFKSHILTKKSAKTKRNLRTATITDPTNAKVMKKLLLDAGSRIYEAVRAAGGFAKGIQTDVVR